MKKLSLTLFYLCCYHVYAQSGFSVGLATSLDRTAVHPSIASAYNKGGLGYSAGFRLRYDLNAWLSFQTGFSAVSTRYIADREGMTYLDQFTTTQKLPTDKFRAVADIKSFQIPLLCSFYFGNQFKVGFSVGSAVNYAYRRNRNITWYFDDAEFKTSSTRKVDDKQVFGSFFAGVGCEYSIGKFIIRAEPTAQYSFLPEHRDSPNDRYTYWSIGLGVSSFYRF